jgi:hypothetical protein
MNFSLTNLTGAITAIGALGTAAFGIVDATKLVGGGVSSSGFCFIRSVVEVLAPDAKAPANAAGATIDVSATSQKAILATARANWLNGMALADQKSALKALIKLRLNSDTAPNLAKLMGVDPAVLTTVAIKLAGGDPDPAVAGAPVVDGAAAAVAPAAEGAAAVAAVAVAAGPAPMTPAELDIYGRFDLLLSMTLDRALQRADQRYRNTAKVAAGFVAVVLAEAAAFSLLGTTFKGTSDGVLFCQALIAGLLATPLAPIAKDLASSLNTAAKAVQSVKS